MTSPPDETTIPPHHLPLVTKYSINKTKHTPGSDHGLCAPKRRKLDKEKEREQGPAKRLLRPCFSHDDYTVGWTYALPLKIAAAEAMLGYVHLSKTLANPFECAGQLT